MSNPLKDVLSPGVRRVLYAVLFVIILAFGAVQAATADGQVDWLKAAATFISALIPLLAASNVNTTPEVPVLDQVTYAQLVKELQERDAALAKHTEEIVNE